MRRTSALRASALSMDSAQVSVTNMPGRYHYDYKTIGLKERDYLALAKKKQAVEREIGKHLNWSDFLLFTAGLKDVAEEQRISRLAQGEAPDEEPRRPPLPDTSELEEMVARHVHIAMKEMKKRR